MTNASSLTTMQAAFSSVNRGLNVNPSAEKNSIDLLRSRTRRRSGHYHPASANGVRQPWAIIVLELKGDKIAAWNSFLDTEKLFPLFGLPPSLA